MFSLKSCSSPLGLLSIGGLGLVGTLLFRWVIIESVISSKVHEQVRLDPTSPFWKSWIQPGYPVFNSFYLFNITNPEDVMNKGTKPLLKEMGPYVYEEKREKLLLTPSGTSGSSIKYRPKSTYFFRPELSHGLKDVDNITLPNIPFIGVVKVAWELSKESFVLSTLDDLLAEKGERLFHNHPVKDYLFDGVSIESYMDILSLPVPQMVGKGRKKISIPKRLMDGDFGFLDDRNGTAEELWEMDKSTFQIKSYNGHPSLDIWKDPKCDVIQGTDGTMFPTPLGDTLHIYHPDFCRSFPLKLSSSNSEFMGLPTYKYEFPQEFWNNEEGARTNCFCKDAFHWCKKGGVVPLGPCFGGAPLFLSQPHFKDAPSTQYKDAIDIQQGLSSSNNESHPEYGSYIEIDPRTGIPVHSVIRMQINVEVESYGEMTSFINAPNLMLPVMWMEQTTQFTPPQLQPLKKLATLQSTSNIITGIGLISSFVLGIGAVIWGNSIGRENKDRSQNTPDNSGIRSNSIIDIHGGSSGNGNFMLWIRNTRNSSGGSGSTTTGTGTTT